VVGSEIEKKRKKMITNVEPNIVFAQAPSMNRGDTVGIKMSS
jgi:hypothetical protein